MTMRPHQAIEESERHAVERVLVSRVGRVGDMVMITPALHALLRLYPNAELHLLTSPDGAFVLRGFDPRVTRRIVYRRKGLGQSLRRWRIHRQLRAADYDVVYGFDERETYQRLLADVGRTRHLLPRGSGRDVPYPLHCLQLIHGPEAEEESLWLPVTDDARRQAREMLAGSGVTDAHLVVGLHPSFAALGKLRVRRGDYMERKSWPVEAWGELARAFGEFGLLEGRPIAVVVDLLPEERELGRRVVEASGGMVRLFTLPPHFERYKALLERMDLLVTPDTGPMHVAGAVGTRLVALFTRHHAVRYRPFVPPERARVLVADSSGPDADRLATITPDEVLEAALEQLRAGLGGAH